jgi:two-component system NtrC family sensor kinase
LEGAERVRKIVQDLKGFSRVDEADEKLADIIQCLESTINIAWSEIKNAAALRKEFGDIPQIKCFPQQLNQVFMNLLVNAAQAISGYGEIIVRTWNDAENVFVSVCDNGSGIPEDVQQRIFEPFFTTKESGKGTGLGLSISYDIVKKHGGDLMLVSQPGQGTTFTVRLPINNIP